MGLAWVLIIYFFVGLMQDLLITWQAVAIIEKRPVLSGALSALNTIVAATIWHQLIPTEGQDFWVNGITYAVGGAVGVCLTIWYKKKRPYVPHIKGGTYYR